MKYMSVPVYEYKELDDQAQTSALNNLLDAWQNCVSLVPERALDGYRKAQDEVCRNRTPWFFKEALYDYCREIVDEELNGFYYSLEGIPMITLETVR